MKILHHGCTYLNYCKCRQCGCEFIYNDNETIHALDYFAQPFINSVKPFTVWTSIQCPECKCSNEIYHYNGKIDKVRKYDYWGNYKEIDFDENTMERR